MSTVRSSSAASRSEINTAIFKHCVVDGHISHIQKICDPVPKDFKAAVMSSESVFHHPETRDSDVKLCSSTSSKCSSVLRSA